MKNIVLVAATLFTLTPSQKNDVALTPALPPEERLDIPAVPTNDAVSMAISPNGKRLVFSGLCEKQSCLWVRFLDSGEQHPLPGTEQATYPFWSPDSGSIGFFADLKIRRIDVETKAVRDVATGVTWGAGGTWNRDGMILFGRQGQYTLLSVRDTGGPIERVTRIDGPRQLVHVHPQFLPDGRHFLYYVQGLASDRGIYVGDLNGPGGRRLVDSEAAGAYASGRLLFLSSGTLFAQPFDPVRLTLSGSPAAIAQRVPVTGRSVGAFSAAGDNVIFRSGPEGGVQQLTWFDRSGKKLSTVGDPFVSAIGAPSLSPDGKTVVLNRLEAGNGDIWTMDVTSGVFTRFTSDPANDMFPVWSSDGRRIVFSSNRTNHSEIYEKPVGVPAAETLLFGTRDSYRHPMDWSRDGRYLIYRTGYPDLWALRLDGFSEVPIIPDPTREIRWPQFDPSGRWIAFQSKTGERNEIYIHGPFDPPTVGQTSEPVSTNGGVWPRWRPDGKELFFYTPDGTLMAVPVVFDSGNQGVRVGQPIALFQTPMIGSRDNVGQQYIVSNDGQRFLVVAAPFEQSPVHVLLNWKPH